MNRLKSATIVTFFLSCAYIANSTDKTIQYIEQYKSIAIDEMNRIGIPASIKMAQAIVESASGRSTLARQSNNHFGIKCGKNWSGNTVYKEDDDYENGLLIRSCFRAFDDPAESFYAHSDFISNPKSKRYGFLFELNLYDYKAWARGLKKSGYATDPKYPQKLISIIEKYSLYELDYIGVDKMEEQYVVEKTRDDIITKVLEPLIKQDIARVKSSDDVYIVQLGDNMELIAESFDIALETLYFQNRMAYGTQPAVGESLKINGYLQFKNRPKIRKHITSAATGTDKFLFEEIILFETE